MSIPSLTPMRTTAMTRDTAIAIIYLFVAEAIARGIDYISGDGDDVTQSLTFIERVAPLWVWGVACIGVGSLSLIGLFLQRYEPIIIGATFGFALYTTFAVGLSMNVIHRGWPPDGFRTPGMFLCFALVWLMVAIEMKVARSIALDIQEGRLVHGADTGDAG